MAVPQLRARVYGGGSVRCKDGPPRRGRLLPSRAGSPAGGGGIGGGGGKDDGVGLDPVERLVAKLFPKAYGAEKPFGLDRISVEQFPDQYPSRADLVNAAPVAGDSKDVALFRPLLEQTSLERARLQACFDSSTRGSGGFEEAAFRAACEGKGACVVLGKTCSGCLFGGYTAKGWIGLGDERNEVSAFLFCSEDGGKMWEKLPKVGGGALALLDKPGRGVQFGPDGLRVPLDGRPVAYSRLGTYYAKRTRAASRTSLFGVGETGQADLEWLKVFCDADQTSTARGSFLFGY